MGKASQHRLEKIQPLQMLNFYPKLEKKHVNAESKFTVADNPVTLCT